MDDSLLRPVTECGLNILADCNSDSPKKAIAFFRPRFTSVRLLVTTILEEYVRSQLPVCKPVKCLDLLGSSGINGLLWKHFLKDEVEVIINDKNLAACDVIKENSVRNNLQVEVTNKDPCVLLYEAGYNFIYADCNSDASLYIDAVFRSISRNGVIVFTTKDDPSLQGSNPDAAYRRYGGTISRTLYSCELAFRLILASVARSAAKYNKAITVLCTTSFKGSLTFAILVTKDPPKANECLDQIRYLSHCMVCEERIFHPKPSGLNLDKIHLIPSCKCSSESPGSVYEVLGPIWSGNIFEANFVHGMLSASHVKNDFSLLELLQLLDEESKCLSEENSTELNSAKRLKTDNTCTADEIPPFYYNLHKHHIQGLNKLPPINKVIETLRKWGYRASKTHFNRFSVRTNAPGLKIYEAVKQC